MSPGDCTTAVCIAPDTRLRLSEISGEVGDLHKLGRVEEVTFTRLDEGWYRDAVKFANGHEVSLQSLPAGVTAAIVEPIETPAPSLEDAALVS